MQDEILPTGPRIAPGGSQHIHMYYHLNPNFMPSLLHPIMYTPTILALRGEPISVASISLIYIPIPVTNFVLTLIGVLATCFRLWRRKTTTHIWWDDIWAALTMILGITFMTSFELFLQNQSKRFYFITASGRRHIYVHTNLICSFSFSHSWN